MFPPATYRSRRRTLVEHERPDSGLVLLLGNRRSPRNYVDNPHPFRQDGTFLYYFGLDRPDLVETVGLITTSGVYHIDTSGSVEEDVKDESIEGIENLYETSMEMLDEGITRERVADRLQWLFVEDVDDELVDIRETIYSQEANQAAMRIIYETFYEDVQDPEMYFTTEELRELEVPTFMIHTEHNPSAQKELAEYVHEQIPNSEYHLYAESAHWPQWEEADRYHDDTIDFLSRHAQ